MKYKWYDKETHTAILPVRLDAMEDDKKILFEQLKKLNIELLEKIIMPFDFGFDFYHGKLPDTLHLDEDDEDYYAGASVYQWVDTKNRGRLRTIAKLVYNTVVFTRYMSSDYIHDKAGLIPCVFDNEDDSGEGSDPIWQGKPDRSVPYYERKKPAEDWLDKNYPDWRDPNAYWS